MGNSTKKCNIIIVGLDNSGKSTLINFLKPKYKQEVDLAATVGYKTETFQRQGYEFTVFDMSGQGKYRSLWEKQYGTVEAIIFVVDAADELRFGVAHNELEMILDNPGKYSLSLTSRFFAFRCKS